LIDVVKRYARQVAEFFEFVKKKQETSTEKSNSQSPVLLPHQNGGLWMGPAGNHVPGLDLPPLDLKSLLTRPSAWLSIHWLCFCWLQGSVSGYRMSIVSIGFYIVYLGKKRLLPLLFILDVETKHGRATV